MVSRGIELSQQAYKPRPNKLLQIAFIFNFLFKFKNPIRRSSKLNDLRDSGDD